VRGYRRRNQEQIDQILKALELEEHQDDDKLWKRAFLRLAMALLGLGALSWKLKRSNNNAANWTKEQTFLFWSEMTRLTSAETGDRAAVRRLVREDPQQIRFPYRPKQTASIAGAERKRVDAMLRRWQTMKDQLSEDWEDVLSPKPLKLSETLAKRLLTAKDEKQIHVK
jgi:hypothetical protein